MECKDQCGQTVIPVFYDVDPLHVRNQRESFAEAFDKHETRYKDDDEGMQKLQRWRSALTAAANLKGYDVRDGIEAENIQKIIDQISKLCNSATLSSLRDVVGIETHLEKLKSLLKGTMAMEAIWLHDNFGTLRFSNEAMKNMKRLRILYIERWSCYGSIEYLSNNLHWLVLDGYPCESLPSTFEPKMLVHVQLKHNSLHYLWMETKHLPSLKKLILSGSGNLMRTPDFKGMPNLEYLDLSFCSNFEELHDTLGCCRKLVELNLTWCERLKRFPCVNVESLEYLSLENCSSLEKFPEIHGRMKPKIQIHMLGSGIRELPSSYFQYQTHITELDLSFMRNLVALPSSISRLKSLVSLSVLDCSKLESLPEDIGSLSSLKELYLNGNNFEHLPRSIAQLGALRSLDLSYCQRLTQLPELPPELNELHVDCHMALKFIHDLVTKRKKLQRVIFPDDEDDALDDPIYNLFAHALFQNISSLRHHISASDSLSESVFTILHPWKKIPS
uniref:TMV resistance protein N isoform X2 n=1 Tax=Nicotiana tabacum TaxID=4097 RepID=A0A1S4C785_TOBAC|nr:PREDICTED: TMV resistance protein N-like isoform X2 [Nicotiana tabacum]